MAAAEASSRPAYPAVTPAATTVVDDVDVCVVGAGLAGAMCALMMARRTPGLRVTVYEKRGDLRKEFASEAAGAGGAGGDAAASATKRSINLALSYRGQCALEEVGLLETVMEHAIPMTCRAMHSGTKPLTFQPYGKAGQAINSISRRLLNTLLLDRLEALPNVRLVFNHKCVSVDTNANITFAVEGGGRVQVRARVVVGADGAYSGVRTALLRITRADFSRQYIEHGYKELTVPPAEGHKFALEPHNALHIWPRGDFMLIALPNPDKSFTATLFAPFSTLNALKSAAAVTRFFEHEFPDIVPLIPDLTEQFFVEGPGSLVTVRVAPWHYKDKLVLLGDAAHAMVPFYGQGMNAGFEDALFLNELMTEFGGNFSQVLPAFSERRQPAGDAIATLSHGNYMEMRAHTASTAFLIRKRIEAMLHALFPRWWIPQYTMVAFTRIPYDEVIRREARQQWWLDMAMRGLGLASVSLLALAGREAYRAFGKSRL